MRRQTQNGYRNRAFKDAEVHSDYMDEEDILHNQRLLRVLIQFYFTEIIYISTFFTTQKHTMNSQAIPIPLFSISMLRLFAAKSF